MILLLCAFAAICMQKELGAAVVSAAACVMRVGEMKTEEKGRRRQVLELVMETPLQQQQKSCFPFLFSDEQFSISFWEKSFFRCFGWSALCWRKGGRKEGSKQSFCTLQIHNQRTEMNVDPLRKPSAVNESTRRAGMEEGRKRTFAKCVLSM